ncbi:YkgJ family cysteine cluster protein [Kordia jejudonensis]|uniref:YkgJ family cysteine cluster protein n=1 Tax=Kordia jejudonensis TaxID=1348245 RepID=UPI0006298354|nr:YkgJ family cysteine cluster protein [Kordia jejudonensis]
MDALNQDVAIVQELERQLERSGYFTHSSLSNQAERINEIESFLYGLIDTLIDDGKVKKEKLEEVVQNVRTETLARKEHFHAGIAIRVDGEEQKDDFVPVNCDERMHICKGVCCKLNFALSVDEIESGTSKWDLGQPYYIRQKSTGYCTHLDEHKQCCSIYNDRPRVCRKYSCADDSRIWTNFEKMELNTEWIENNLQERKIQLQGVYMIPEQKIEYKAKS